MINHLVIFFIRKKLHLKKYQRFRFTNQKSEDDYYYFTSDEILKVEVKYIFRRSLEESYVKTCVKESNVSLMWLLSDRCIIKRLN